MLSKKDIKQGYKGIKHLAQQSYAKGDIHQAFVHVGQCAVLAQQFNWIYSDDELEDLLKNIGDVIIPEEKRDYDPISGRVVFYDDFCTSFVLALQYLDALVNDGKEVLYITSANVNLKSKFAHIVDAVKTRPNVCVHVVPQGNIGDRNRDVYEAIMGFKPEKVLLHIMACSVALPALYRLPNLIQRYIINLADQTFWLGKKAIDYCIEFRQFGVSVSQQRRGIRPDQQLLIPFYPVVDGNPFEGFPKECSSDKVIIFSGGDLYKVQDEKKVYWKLVKKILDNYPQVVLLFATKVTRSSTEIIENFIIENGFQGRFIYLNYRKDINEVFKHCDIYLGTFPASGSLMSQLAAVNAKPILQYYYPGTPDDETEQAVCINENFQVSFRDEEQFMSEAEKLIIDSEYRKKQGERLKRAMISPEQFDTMVSNALQTNVSPMSLKPYKFKYEFLDDRWFALERLGQTDALSYVYSILGNSTCLRFAPGLFLKKHLKSLFSFIKHN